MNHVLSTSPVVAEKIERAFRQAAGTWRGCDWPTRFGNWNFNLDGLKASQALLLARATSGQEQAEWLAATAWLTVIENEAREAEKEAVLAMSRVRFGQLAEALEAMEHACDLEAKYHKNLVWEPLRQAIAAAEKETAAFGP